MVRSIVTGTRTFDSVIATAAGGAAAAVSLACCLGTAALLARQILIGGASAVWTTPALATTLGALVSLGPAGFYSQNAAGSVGLGVEAVALPWAVALAAPVVVAGLLVRARVKRSPTAALGFSLGYGAVFGIGVGLGSMWAISVNSGLELPVSPDLVAGRSALIALAVLVLIQLGSVRHRILSYAQPVVSGGATFMALALGVWIVGLAITVGSVPTGLAESLTTSGSLLGANVTTAALFESVGAQPDLTVESGFTGAVEHFSLTNVANLTDAAVGLIGTGLILLTVIVAMIAAGRRGSDDIPPVLQSMGVAAGIAIAGAILAMMISGDADLILLPSQTADRSFSQARLAVEPGKVLNQLGARSLLVAIPIGWFMSRSRTEPRTVSGQEVMS